MGFVLALTCSMFGCSAQQAEVGADPPLDDGGRSLDGARSDREGANDSADAGVGRCDLQAPLRLYAWNLRTAGSSTDINFIVKVENATGAAIAMSALEVRYYFTNELASSPVIDVFYVDTCCSNKRTDFKDEVVTSLQTLVPKATADAYLQIAFTSSAGPLAAGDAVQVELGFHDVGYMRMLTQTNDYSYAASAGGTQAQWNDCPGPRCEAKFTSCALTVSRDGVLVWGTPP